MIWKYIRERLNNRNSWNKKRKRKIKRNSLKCNRN